MKLNNKSGEFGIRISKDIPNHIFIRHEHSGVIYEHSGVICWIGYTGIKFKHSIKIDGVDII